MLLAASQPLAELEGILAIDGFPHERIPVDDFFGEYLHGLTAMAAQAGAPAGGKGSDGSCLSDSGTPLSSGTPPLTAAGPVPSGAMSGAATAQHPHLLHAQQPHGAAAMAWPMVPGMPMPQLAQVAVMPAPAAQLRAGLMAVPVGKLPVPVSNGKSGCALNGRTSASSQRQATNREAQKRYRERQKARLLEMQVAIDRLTGELQDRLGVQRQNAALEEQHDCLQAQLAHVESEAEVLAWQAQQAAREAQQLAPGGSSAGSGAAAMDADAAAGGSAGGQGQTSLDLSEAGSAVAGSSSATPHSGSAGDLAAAAGDTAAAAAAAGTSGSSELPAAVAEAAAGEVLVAPEQGGPSGFPGMYGAAPAPERFDQLMSRFQAQVGKVKSFLDEEQLRTHDPAGVVMSTATRGQLLQLITESLGICRELLRVEGQDVIESLQRADEAAEAARGTAPGSHVRTKWLHVLHALRLAPEQQAQLLLQRAAHLGLMRRIYQQRQQLNVQAMSLMLLPSCGGHRGNGGGGGGRGTQLATLLRLIKDNLRREQRAAMEINACTLCRILMPVQAGIYIAEAFPFHCDALAMCNVLSTLGTGAKAPSGAGSAGSPGASALTPVSSNA